MLRAIIHRGWLLAIFLVLAVTASLAQPQKASDEKKSRAIKSAIENYIKNDVEVKGAFLLGDPIEGTVLNLSFDGLDKNVGSGKDGSPFVCADFRDKEGKKYDVDVYVSKADGKWIVKKVIIHKVDGEVRR